MVIDLSSTPVAEPLLDTLASIEKFEQTPLLTQFPHTNSYDLFLQSGTRFADEPAIEFLLTGQRDEKAQTITFGELANQITQTANLLHTLGLQKTDAVSILLPILPQSHPAIWGSQAAAIANPINPMLEAEHIAEIIDAAQAKAVICLAPSPHSDLWEKLQKIVQLTKTVEVVLVVQQPGLTNNEPPVLKNSSIRVIDYNTAIAAQPTDRLLSMRCFSAEQVAAYFHTGGTTGRPKIAQLTHGNMAFLGQLMQVYTAHLPRHTILCGLPLFHIYGVIIQGISAFSVGYRIVLMTPAGFRSPEGMKNFWHHIARFQVRGFSTVPTVLMALSQIPVGDADISCLTNINSGAAPLPHAFEQSFEKKFSVEVANGYGMTETTALISRAPAWQPPGSVGMRLPYSRVRIAHLNNGRITKECALGESGVILVKGPQVFCGYKAAGDNADAWVEDGWFNTGDLGYLDADGFVYLSGRAKDLIIRGGHNIDPALIEEALNGHPVVASAVAVGMPDAYAGELPMAFVVLQSGAECTARELLDFCEQRITERAAVPRRIEIISAMPLTAVGKIYKPLLRQRISENVLREVLEEQHIAAEINGSIDKQRGLVINIDIKDAARKAQAMALLEPYALTMDFV
ncbi:MAG: acyl-CoA synthetase [Gammaproteobacteria bacterium]|nr:acyl-CoA synthetase [Gammaproteobacteria bacterium]MDP2139423.1 acyl-CoA synthetase [Gammaproteobacteria bacterium]MDP2346259.1 acyl-CoA synthetase [Gammaproteobacteria bacterium]